MLKPESNIKLTGDQDIYTHTIILVIKLLAQTPYMMTERHNFTLVHRNRF